jgi:hypothetical protein
VGTGSTWSSVTTFLTNNNPSGWNGTFSLAPGFIYSNLILVLTDGQSKDPRWAAFSITGDGVWSIINNDGGHHYDYNTLSHALLYGTAIQCPPSGCPGEVGQTPLPPAVVLFGTALVGLGVLGRRRRTTGVKMAA